MKKKLYLIVGLVVEVIYLALVIPNLFNKYIPFNGPSINKFLVYKSYIKYLNSKELLLKFTGEAFLRASFFTLITLGAIYLINHLITTLRN